MTQTIEAVAGTPPVERGRTSPPATSGIARSPSQVPIHPEAAPIPTRPPGLDRTLQRGRATYDAVRAGAVAARHARHARSPAWQRIFDAAERIAFISGIDLFPLLDPGHDEAAWTRLADHLQQVVDRFGPSPAPLPADTAEAEAARSGPRPRELRAALDWVDRKERELAHHALHIDRKLRSDIEGALKSLRGSLQAVQGSRFVRGMLLPVTLLLGSPVVALTYLSRPQQLRGAILLMASVLKTLVWTVGAVARPSTGWSTARHVLVHRHFTNFEETALQIPNAAPTARAEELAAIPGYLVGVIGISFVLTMGVLFGGKLWTRGRDALHATPTPPDDASTRAFLEESSEETRQIRAAVDDFFRGHAEAGARISNTGNVHANRMLAKAERLMTLFLKANGVDPRVIAELHAAKNRDALPKGVRTAAYDFINAVAILPFWGDRIAMGTMIADWFITASILGDEWLDPNVNDARMEESGQNWVALSATLIVPMGISRILDLFGLGIEAGGVTGKAFKAFAGVVAGGNLVFPKWIGAGVNKAVSTAVRCLRRGDRDSAARALDTAGWIAREMHRRGVLDGQLGDEPTLQQRAAVDEIVREAERRETS